MIRGMPRTEYVRCLGCGMLNPVKEGEEGVERTCVFCGRLFTPPAKAVEEVEASFKKRIRGKKPLNPSATRPENRNKSKPNI